MVTTLKIIPVSQISPSSEQPRENFDKEKIKELAESILSNGLINPITVRKEGSKFFIVAGERRWRAHKLAGLKTIDAFVKEYKNEGIWMVESLIENVQREDLTPAEKGKFCVQIMKIENISNNAELSRRVKINQSTIAECIDNYEFTKNKPAYSKTKHKIIRSTAGMEDSERKKIIKFAEKQKMSGTKIEEEFVPIYKKATPEIKDALLDDKITVDQAKDLMKINSPMARKKALKETTTHRRLADITPQLAENAKPELTAALKKSFNSVQKIIFTHLYDAKIGVIKSNKNLKQANKMLVELMGKQFEYALTDKVIALSIEQLTLISDRVSEFKLSLQRFEELKEQFVDRIENKND